MSLLSCQPIPKLPGEVIDITMPFALFPEVSAAGQSVASAVATSDNPGLTVGAPSVSGTDVIFRVSAGVPGTTYNVTVLGTLSGGAVRGAVVPIPVGAM